MESTPPERPTAIFMQHAPNMRYKWHTISKIKSLTVYNTTNKNVEIKRDVRCVNIFLDDLEEITLINVNIQFAKPFPSLKRIRVVNSFGYCYYDITKYWENIDYLSLEYQYIEDLMFFMGALENKVKSLSVLKIKLNSIDLENKLNWNAFCAFDLFVKANEIYLNIKSKLLFDENVDETSSRIMNKVKEFKLLPYNRIKPEIIEAYLTNSKEQLTKLTLLKIKNVKLPNIATIIEDKCPNLELIDIDEPENDNNNTLNEYKYKIHLHDDFSLLNSGNFFNSYNYMKIQKIELPFLYFNKKRKELLIRGDAIGPNKQSLFKCEPNQDPESYVIDQTFYTFMDNVLSNTPFLNKVIIRNFENPKTSSMDILTFLNNVLITYQHALIEVPKIKKIKLIDLVLDTSIMANIGFLLKINEKSLKKVELNNIKIISNELGGDNVVDDSAIHLNDLFRFSSFPITKVSFKNFQGDSNIKPIIEHELLQRTKILSLESITNYDISNVIMRANNAVIHYNTDLALIEKMRKAQGEDPLFVGEKESLEDKMRNQFIFKKNEERQRVVRIKNALKNQYEDIEKDINNKYANVHRTSPDDFQSIIVSLLFIRINPI